jgi:hypothetical protein
MEAHSNTWHYSTLQTHQGYVATNMWKEASIKGSVVWFSTGQDNHDSDRIMMIVHLISVAAWTMVSSGVHQCVRITHLTHGNTFCTLSMAKHGAIPCSGALSAESSH